MNIISNFSHISKELKGHLLCANEYVDQFTQLSGHYTEKFDRVLRINLFIEEFREFEKANEAGDRVEELDAILDMAYILVGTIQIYMDSEDGSFEDERIFWEQASEIQGCILKSEFGKRDDFYKLFYLGFMEVHRSNMSKFFYKDDAEFIDWDATWTMTEITEGMCCVKDENGKVRKPSCYQKPQLELFVKAYLHE